MRYKFLFSQRELAVLVAGFGLAGILTFGAGMVTGAYWQLRVTLAAAESRTETAVAAAAPAVVEPAPVSAAPVAAPPAAAAQVVPAPPPVVEPLPEPVEQEVLVYELQLAFFLAERDAKSFAEELRGRGFDPLVVEVASSRGAPRYTVRLSGYGSLEEAADASAEFREVEGWRAVIRWRDVRPSFVTAEDPGRRGQGASPASLPPAAPPHAATPREPARAEFSLSAGPAPELRFDLSQPVPGTPYGDLIYRVSRRYSMNPGVVAAMARVESGFDQFAVSGKGAIGLMQVMPETARRFGVEATDLLEVEWNLVAGVRYLDWLTDRFAGDPVLVLAAYNAGEGQVEEHGGVPPFGETRDYVRRVVSLSRAAEASGAGGAESVAGLGKPQ